MALAGSITMTTPTTRTVCLTPIKSEVDGYLESLKKDGIKVIRVDWPKLPGFDVRITIECKQ
jgi:hypothetical protein